MTEVHRDLLLEIGTEEIPARFGPLGLEQLQQKAEAAFKAARLDFHKVETFGTPRRLVMLVHKLALQQRDEEIVAKGPAVKVAFDADGKPTKAAEAFARSQQVPVESLYVGQDAKGEYVFARRVEAGQSVGKVLPPILESLILALEFPKSMRWADRSIRFARPIKWICALLGSAKVPLNVDGYVNNATTLGHRWLAPAGEIQVTDPVDYFKKVTAAWVMVDQIVRRNVTWQMIETAARTVGGTVPKMEDLLDEVTWLVEQPFAFVGSFDQSYLEVPGDVLVTTMVENQRYFPVYDAAGKLMPYFIGLRNGDDRHIETVIRGNEKVLRARFSDARFFYDEDRKQALADRLPALDSMVFQEKLGSMTKKVERVAALAAYIAGAAGYSSEDVDRAVAAARLAKADLATHLVYEFTNLQGYIGKELLLREGADPVVATAVEEHYLPKGAGSALPATAPGVAVALADKLDTLAGYFSVGMIPSGSQDPFALRRAASGVVAILAEQGLGLYLSDLIDRALRGYDGSLPGQPAVVADPAARAKTAAALQAFFTARLKVQLEERGYRYDVIDAVLSGAGAADRMLPPAAEDPADALRRAEALAAAVADPDFASVMTAFKRVSNLAAKAEGAVRVEPAVLREQPEQGYLPAKAERAVRVNPALLQEEPEKELWAAFQDFRGPATEALSEARYEDFFRLAVTLKAPVDLFLDKTLVMAEDLAVRHNRLSLLATVAALLTEPAELAKLVV